MRVAVFHNQYVHRGGEDAVVALETELLRKAGHRVHAFLPDSRELRTSWDRLRAARNARWNSAMAERVSAFLAQHPVDVAHVHNFFPLLSPAVHATLRAHGVPVVQTLHNYRLYCANGLFLRQGRPCEECVERGPWNALRYGCYRGSRLQTAVWAEATQLHRRLGTWDELVDRFITPSEFARRKLVAAGLEARRITVKPNPVPDPGMPMAPGHGAVYVGRLSAEKGVALLLEAWPALGGYPLTIVGTGPEEEALRRRGERLPGVRFTGLLSTDAVRAELARAAFAVAPSLCYENFPLAVVEAQAAGRAVVASHPTAMGELVEDGRTGLRFQTGNAAELAAACRRLAEDPEICAELGREARMYYEDHLSPERGLERLLEVYREVAGPA